MFFDRRRAPRPRVFPALVGLACVALGATSAGRTGTEFRFARDSESRHSVPGLNPGLQQAPPRVEWSGRDDPRALAFAREAFQRLAEDWKLPIDRRAGRVLRLELSELVVDERAESVGATYGAFVTLSVSFLGEDERVLWKGRARGTSSRFGRAGHPRIANLTLSDAFTEALAALLEQDALQDAWLSTESVESAAVAGTRRIDASADSGREKESSPDLDRTTPGELRDDLVSLMKAGFDEAHLLDVVDTKVLARAFDEKDLASWRAAGIPETVLRAARARPVL